VKWFRWHHDSCEDAKFRMVARVTDVTVRDVIALWAALLESASRNEPRGIVPNNRIDFIEAVLDMPSHMMDQLCEAMEDAGLIQASEFEIRILNWNKRQFDTDLRDGTNAERQKRYRDRKRARNAESNGTVTPQIQITDTESERETRTPAAAPTKGTRFPHESLPDPWKQFCLEQRPDLDPSATFDRCRDYWISAPGQRGVKRDWDATWRNWVRNERKPVTITATTVISGAPPPGFREAKTTGEYIEYLRHKHNDPKLTFGDYRVSKYQYVPVEWNVSDMRKVAP